MLPQQSRYSPQDRGVIIDDKKRACDFACRACSWGGGPIARSKMRSDAPRHAVAWTIVTTSPGAALRSALDRCRPGPQPQTSQATCVALSQRGVPRP